MRFEAGARVPDQRVSRSTATRSGRQSPPTADLGELSASPTRAGVAEFVGENSCRSVGCEVIGVVAGVLEPVRAWPGRVGVGGPPG